MRNLTPKFVDRKFQLIAKEIGWNTQAYKNGKPVPNAYMLRLGTRFTSYKISRFADVGAGEFSVADFNTGREIIAFLEGCYCMHRQQQAASAVKQD